MEFIAFFLDRLESNGNMSLRNKPRGSVFFFFLSLLMMALAGYGQTGPNPTVYWYYNDFPPYFIVSAPYEGKGSGDQQMQSLIRRMPQFRHERVLASHSRAVEMMKTQGNVCHTSLFKTPERAADMDFSAPVLPNLPNGFITLRAHLHRFKPFLDKQGQLRLDDFLADGRYRLGIVAGRSFGKDADDILKKHVGQKSVVVVSSNDGLASRLLKLVNQHEYDAVLGYAYELQYVARQLKLDERDFAFIPLVQLSALEPIYVACSKSALGKQVVAAVNLVLADPAARREIDDVYRFWLDEESAARWDRLRTQARPQ